MRYGDDLEQESQRLDSTPLVRASWISGPQRVCVSPLLFVETCGVSLTANIASLVETVESPRPILR